MYIVHLYMSPIVSPLCSSVKQFSDILQFSDNLQLGILNGQYYAYSYVKVNVLCGPKSDSHVGYKYQPHVVVIRPEHKIWNPKSEPNSNRKIRPVI